MALLRPKSERKTGGLPQHRFLTCPLNGHQVCFCRGLCEPVDSLGQCGRVAPHAMIGRTQLAIAAHNRAKLGG